MFEHIFQNKKPNKEKLADYGFVYEKGAYLFSTDILKGQFHLQISINQKEEVKTCVFDEDTDDEYTLYLSESATGAFVGKVREEIESVLCQISTVCFETSMFKNACTQQVIQYVKETYGDDLEFLWEKLPNCAIWRRKDNKKWYAALLTLSQNKLGIKGTKTVEILNVSAKPEDVENLVDNKKYFAGYHMNKKHWITIVLEGDLPFKEICERIDDSYLLAKKK